MRPSKPEIYESLLTGVKNNMDEGEGKCCENTEQIPNYQFPKKFWIEEFAICDSFMIYIKGILRLRIHP